MVRLGQAEGDDSLALQHPVDELGLLLEASEIAEHQDEGIVADDRMLVLEVVVKAQPLGRQMLADDGHPQVRAVLPPIFPRHGEAIVAGPVGATLGFPQERLPFGTRQAAIVEVGARPFAAVIEEALVVILGLQRPDLGLDEGIELGQIGLQVGGQFEIHGLLLKAT